jgi:NADH-quinone oxidoreductase subunit G
MERIASQVPDYAGVTYQKLAEVVDQWPIIARADLYYGGTSYENSQGLGVQLQPAAQRGEQIPLGWLQPSEAVSAGERDIQAVPITRLYDRGQTVIPSDLLHQRIPEPYLVLHPQTAGRMGIADSSLVSLHLNGLVIQVTAFLDETVPENVALVPRSLGIPITDPVPVEVEVVEKIVA